METKTQISKNLEENIQAFEALFVDCADVKKNRICLGKDASVKCYVAFIELTLPNVTMADSILGKMLNHLWDMPKEDIYMYLQKNGLGISDMQELSTIEETAKGMLTGDAVLFVEGYDKAYKISSRGYPNMGVQQVKSEQVSRGSNEGFMESIKANETLIRKRIKSPKLKIKESIVGVRSNTTVSLIYMSDIVRPELLERVESQLQEYEIDGVLDSGILEQLMEHSWRSPFPQFQTTERPDKAAMAVLEGRIVLLCDNSPVSILLPTNYNCFFQTTDDYYNRWQIVTLERLIRYMASFLAMVLPALYLAIAAYHTQVLPTELVLSIAAARKGVPFPALVELLFMELAFELLREAGIRIPGNMGNAIGIVGGLIIGQSAVEANIVSPIVVIVVALTALASFAIPNEEFVTAYRLIKFGLIILTAFFGFYGVVLGELFVFVHLSGLKSFGVPYLTPFVGADLNEDKDMRDTVIRQPMFRLVRRAFFANQNQKIRLKRKGE